MGRKLIYLDDALDRIREYCGGAVDKIIAKRLINQMPKIAEYKRKTAKWIEFSTDPRNGDIIYKCSNCGAKTRCNFENYCFECGAYMKEDNNG